MGAGPSVMYAAQAVEAYDQFRAKADAAKAQKALARRPPRQRAPVPAQTCYRRDAGAAFGSHTSLRWSNRTFQSTRVKQ
jgi:hypothetical protein